MVYSLDYRQLGHIGSFQLADYPLVSISQGRTYTPLSVFRLALWERKIKIAIPLAILAVAHWVILWRGMFIIDAQYSPEAQGCIVVSTNHGLLMASFFSSAYILLTLNDLR